MVRNVPSTAEHFLFDTVKHGAPLGAGELAAARGGDAAADFGRPRSLDVFVRCVEARQQFGGDPGAIVERQLKSGFQYLSSRARHDAMLARPYRLGSEPVGARVSPV